MINSALIATMEGAVNALGLQWVGCEMVSQGQYSVLRVYIDKENGVTVDDCQTASKQLSAVLAVEDPKAGRYNLEVSSPGVERPLFTMTQFGAYVGSKVQIRVHAPMDGRRNFKGLLKAISGEDLIVEVDGEEFTLAFANVDKANLSVY